MSEAFLQGASLPFRNYPGVSHERAVVLHLSRNQSVIDTGSPVMGATGKVTTLDWDTGLLGLRCARLDGVTATSGDSAIEIAHHLSSQAKALRIEHLSVRFDAEDQALIKAFQNSGFEEVDGIVTFALDLSSVSVPEMPEGVSLSTHEDAEEVAEISRIAFTIDRFHSDPILEKARCDELHAVWARNSVLGKAADGVVILKEDGKVQGFVTCKIHADTEVHLGVKIGTIVLVAIAPESQGKGYGKQLVAGSLRWFADQGCDIVEVGTQTANTAAMKLYQSAGFTKVAASVSLRKVLPT
jgi:ribosomal protein S18 acetylase RimI-like enzyme